MSGRQPATLGLPLGISLAIHAALIVGMVVHFEFSRIQPVQELSGQIVQATAIDLSDLRKMQKRKPKPQPVEEKVEPKPNESEPVVEPQPLPEVVKQQEEQAQKVAVEQAAQRVHEQKLKEEEAKLALAQKKKKEEAEQKKKEEAERKKKAEDDKKKKEAAEQKQKEEAEQKKREETKRLAEEKRQRLEAEAKRRAEEADLEAQMEEDAASNAARQKQITDEVELARSRIMDKIRRNWIKANETDLCTVRVRLGFDGSVLEIRGAEGPELQCRSAVAALHKAEPLPVPKDPEVFDKFRDTRFPFDPNKQ